MGDILELTCLGYGSPYKAIAVIEERDFQYVFHMIEKPEGIEWNPVAGKWQSESTIIGNVWEDPELLSNTETSTHNDRK